MKQPVSNFKEEFRSKLPALALLSHLGYQFVPPLVCKQMPVEFADNKRAQAYYGLFQKTAGLEIPEASLIQFAFVLDNIVQTAVAEFSINPSEIENAISVKLLPKLFDAMGLDKAQILIEEVLKITRLEISRS